MSRNIIQTSTEEENMHALVFNKSRFDNHNVSDQECKNEYLQALIDEVVKNGYKYDLCLECKKDDNCKHEYYSILNIVDEKLNCARHKQMQSPLTREQMHIIHRVVTVIMTCV